MKRHVTYKGAYNGAMPGWFYKLGESTRSVGRKGRWVWQNIAGSEEDAIKAEFDAGSDLAKQFEAEAPMLIDDPGARMVKQIGDHMSKSAKNKHRQFQFRVALLPEPNAFALPGGFIFVTRALLELCGLPPLTALPPELQQFQGSDSSNSSDDNSTDADMRDLVNSEVIAQAIEAKPQESAAVKPVVPPSAFDEVAFILGHEMAHVMRGHAMQRMVNSTVVNAATQSIARVAAIGGLMGRLLFGAGSKFLHSAYSQDQELEADELGARLSAASGYDPNAAIHMLSRLQKYSGGDDPIDMNAYFSTHPPFDVRLKSLGRLIKP